MPPWWTPWSRLSWWGRVKRAAAAALVTHHLAAMLAMGAATHVRKRFAPLFEVYGDRLKLTNTWGMFSRPPSSTHVRIEAVDREGRVYLLSTTEVRGKGLYQRFRDARLRKLQSKLGAKKERTRFGTIALDGWCRISGSKVPEVREVRAVEQVHELRDDRGATKREAAEHVVLRRTCGPLRAHDLPVLARDRDGEEEDT